MQFFGLGRRGGEAAAPRAPIQALREGIYAEADHEKSEDSYADNVLTDNIDETWNSGRKATPQSPVELRISLGKEGSYVEHLHLLPYQVPSTAQTHHKVFLDDELVADLSGETSHHKPLPPVPVKRTGKCLRIQTVSSPSWVAWSQVHVYGAPSSQ